MKMQLTDVAVAQLQANTGPIPLKLAKLGSAYNYVPSPTDTDIHGTLVFSQPPSQPIVLNANIVRYSILLDYDLGDFDFGELGFFNMSDQLFALGAWTELQHKLKKTSVDTGNSIRIDAYLNVVGDNYDMWFDTAETNNQFRMAVISNPNQLPPSHNAVPNAYIIKGADSHQSAFMAYTDRDGLWNFDAYKYGNTREVEITATDGASVTIARPENPTDLDPRYFGMLIAQFSTGADFSICRYIESAVVSGSTMTLNFDTPLLVLPAVGDKVLVFSREMMSTDLDILPIATHTQLGAVIIGDTLTVTPEGLIDVDQTKLPVTSVNGMTGDVIVRAGDIPDLARVAITGSYNDLRDRPADYALPVATKTTLGGVKASADDSILVAPDGTLSLASTLIKTVNEVAADAQGNIDLAGAIPGLVYATLLTNNQNLDSLTRVGLYYAPDAVAQTLENAPGVAANRKAVAVEVVPLYDKFTGGDVAQRWSENGNLWLRQSVNGVWTPWAVMVTPGNLPIASTSARGIMQVGAGLNVNPQGLVSTVIQSVNGKSDQAIQLTATDVGAIPDSDRGVPGGVATLDSIAPPPADQNPYLWGRVPKDQLPWGTVIDQGVWDASTNETNPGDPDNIFGELLPNGQIQIDLGDGSGMQPYDAPGFMFRVSVGGTTSLDGISNWNAGDIVISVGGKWNRIQTSSSGYTLPIASDTVLGGIKVGTSLEIAADGTLDVKAGSSFTQVYDMPIFIKGVPLGGAVCMRVNCVRALRMAAGLPLSLATAEFAATNQTVLTLKKNATNIGTITFNAGATAGTIVFTTQVDFAAGDVFYIVNQATADPTLADISITIAALR